MKGSNYMSSTTFKCPHCGKEAVAGTGGNCWCRHCKNGRRL